MLSKEKSTKEAPKYKINNNNLDFLVIFKNKKGEFEEKLYKMIPDAIYLIENKGKINSSNYTGLVIVTDWFGNLKEGYKYINGKGIAKINSLKNARVSSFECETIDWWSCGSGDGGNTWYCSYSHSETFCYNTGGGGAPDEDYPNPEFPNGGGDGSSGCSNCGSGDINFTNALPPGSKPLQVHTDKCSGAQALWSRA